MKIDKHREPRATGDHRQANLVAHQTQTELIWRILVCKIYENSWHSLLHSLSHILCAKSFTDSIVQYELGPWSLIPLVDRVTGQLLHCFTEFKQQSSTKLLEMGYPAQSTK